MDLAWAKFFNLDVKSFDLTWVMSVKFKLDQIGFGLVGSWIKLSRIIRGRLGWVSSKVGSLIVNYRLVES